MYPRVLRKLVKKMSYIYNFGLFAYFFQGKTDYESPVFLVACAAAVILCMAAGYFFGSINASIIVSKIFYRDDIRKYGSGNAGMTNMLRIYGKKAALFTLLGDVLKTAAAVLLGRLIGFPLTSVSSTGQFVSIGGYIAAMFAVLGHTFPVYYKFKGGKGVLSIATAICMLQPLVFLFLFIIFAIIVLGTKYVSLGSVISVMVYPILLDRINGTSICTVFAFVIAIIVVFNHRENIKRLWAGQENKLSLSSKGKREEEQDEESDGKQ